MGSYELVGRGIVRVRASVWLAPIPAAARAVETVLSRSDSGYARFLLFSPKA